jgi:hypothetical protein
METMTHYPLLFGFSDLIAGNGFVAGVAIQGRALLVQEEDGFWMNGVNPGALAAGGKTPAEAQAAFRETYRSVLFDMAHVAESFETFRREVEAFFHQTDEPTIEEWNRAVQAVRQGRVEADWLGRKPAESAIGIEVSLLRDPNPSVNELDQAVLAA